MSTTIQQLILAIVCTSVLGGGLLWLNVKLNARTQTLETSMQTIANEDAVQREFVAVSRLLDATEADRATIGTYVVDGQQGSIALLNEVEGLAEQLGVVLRNARISTQDSDEFKTQVVTLSYQLEGTVPAFNQFVSLLEQLPYASYLQQLERTVRRNEAGADTVVGQIELVVAARNIEL